MKPAIIRSHCLNGTTVRVIREMTDSGVPDSQTQKTAGKPAVFLCQGLYQAAAYCSLALRAASISSGP
jgi:hypothetical protein